MDAHDITGGYGVLNLTPVQTVAGMRIDFDLVSRHRLFDCCQHLAAVVPQKIIKVGEEKNRYKSSFEVANNIKCQGWRITRLSPNDGRGGV